MPDVVTFDGPNKIIREIDTGGDNTLNVEEVYSEWKVWVATSDNSKFLQAFSTIGGNPITPTRSLGVTYFMLNGWRVKPAELSHSLELIGNIYVDGGVGDVFVDTDGAFNVRTKVTVSNLVDSSVAQLDVAQLLNAVYLDTSTGNDANQGTNTAPVATLSRAFEIADDRGLSEIRFSGDITLDRALTRFRFVGSSELSSSIDLDGQSLSFCRFDSTRIVGVQAGQCEFVECEIDSVTGLEGLYRQCGFLGSLSVAASGNFVCIGGLSANVGGTLPVFSVGANAQIGFRGFSGGLEIQDMTAGVLTSVDLMPGRVVLGPSNVGGTIVVRGLSQISDTSAGATVVSAGLLEAEKANPAALAAALAAAAL